MDFDLDPGQRDRLTLLASVVDSTGGLERAFGTSKVSDFDADLDAKVAAEAGLLDGDLLSATLLVQEAARLGLAIDLGTRLLLCPDIPADVPSGPVGFVDLDRRGPVRFGADVTSLIAVDGDQARLVTSGFTATPVPSGMSFRYADVETTGDGTVLPPGSASSLRRHRMLALAAEVAGAASAGVEMTAGYLRERHQFGRPLGSLQALRHRLAEAMVYAEALGWLVRSAAYTDAPRDVCLAGSYAVETATRLTPELTQLCGARAFTIDFGLQVFTLRMQAARLALGPQSRIADTYAALV
jgi:Acyl-CoA dehydrogenase, C-terminal domain